MSYLAKCRNYIIVLLVLLAAAVWGVAWLSSPVGKSSGDVLVILPKGATASEVATRLKQKGLIRSRQVFIFTVRLTGMSQELKPGAYKLSRSMSLPQIARKIERGEVAAVWVTIPEGFTLRRIAQRLAARGLVNEESFLQAAHEGAAYDGLSPGKDGSLEGYLFPDTYLVGFGSDGRTVVGDMVRAFREKVLKEHYDEIKASKLGRLAGGRYNLRSVVIVASLIEREAKVPGDRARIAGVIYNRLQKGMKLEIDATVQYARGQHKSRLLFRDLEIKSPYNTYLHAGLPPGPIANPGAASIEAALRPAATDALYYVARRDGSHVFTRSLAEHNAAKRRIGAGS